ncbi:hypothetical protein KIH74_23170 [Kineosporia sp. J2-2]|uniref:Uncharacterized protein n=1 Tax=Kineosporia corallincola TaxID=2835133 RepID=A0ABS5TL94_9ACTN|nr:hypothetical protein [Kineosporia corallincola]MBT0771862.1 hypothetical protein [Kineosporia corallincola]
MFVELIGIAAVGLGAPVMTACVFGRVVARQGRSAAAEAALEPDGRPVLAAVTPGLVHDLPLVAPEGAGYGVAGRLLVRAALERAALERQAAGRTDTVTPRTGPHSRAA